jgi:hypothetical protein
MRNLKTAIAGLALAMLLVPGASAGTDLNEVGALLVYPLIMATNAGPMARVETLATITNAGPFDRIAHVSYINGDSTDSVNYCNECDFPILLTGNDTETLVITNEGSGTHIWAEDSAIDVSCPWTKGMLVVSLENEDEETLLDNVLLGEEVVINYQDGSAFSIPAIPFQGGTGNVDRVYEFNDAEYLRMPRIVAADYLAPHVDNTGNTLLSLFTLGFERRFPPLVDCSVTGWDAHENSVSASFQFGCWAITDICSISPEYCYPNLGLFNNDPHHPISDSHGWLQLNCRVDSNPLAADGFEANGGVHGAIVQRQSATSTMAAGSGATFTTAARWGRLLYQSVTTGDDVSLILVPAAGAGGGL